MKIDSEKIALGIQTKLLEIFVKLVRSSEQDGMLHITLQKTVDLAAEIAGAETGSLFLFDAEGVISDCIMIRDPSSCEDHVSLIGTVMNKGLAGWVVKHRAVGLVRDTREDDRWLDLPDQPYKVRSAIVIPIRKGGNLFGILSLIHGEPNRFDDHTVELMTATADHLAIVLENAKLYQALNKAFHEIEKANDQIARTSKALSAELEKGRRMQRTFLPGKMPAIPGWRIDACFHPAKQVSGDFYDVFFLDEGHLGIVLADICDKGVSAALFMGIIKSLIHAYFESAMVFRGAPQVAAGNKAITPSRPCLASGALAFLNQYLERHHGREGIFVTLFLGVLDTREGSLEYVNAGHEPLIVVRKKPACRELVPTGPAIGLSTEAEFGCGACMLTEGDTLIGFTDGITDAGSERGPAFGRAGVHHAIKSCRGTGDGLMTRILEDVFVHLKDGEQTDDIAMVAITRTGAPHS